MELLKKFRRLCHGLENLPCCLISALCLALALFGLLSGRAAFEYAAWGSILLSGLPLLASALDALLRERRIVSELLISMAILACILSGEDGGDGLFAAAEVAFIMALGEWLEGACLRRSRQSMQRLFDLSEERVCILGADGQRQEIDSAALRRGMRLLLRPGDKVSADGLILEGESSVNQAALTGESLPRDVRAGERIYAGSLNMDGSLLLLVESDAAESSLQKLIRLIQQAEGHKAKIEREANRWASYIVPISLLLALGTYIGGLLFSPDDEETLMRAVTILVVFCPCALALATPTAVMAAIGHASLHGAIIKSGEALETLAHVDCIAFDKTGSLSCGRMELACLLPCQDIPEAELKAAFAALECHSKHPLAQALCRACCSPPAEATELLYQAGRGIRGRLNGRRLYCGNELLLREAGIPLRAEDTAKLQELKGTGLALALLADDKGLLAIAGLRDSLRPEAASVCAELSGPLGLRCCILSGDNGPAVRQAGQALGIGEFYAELLPAEKLSFLEKLRAEKRLPAMLGDGINDAAALKSAAVGISMSKQGSDIADEAADVCLLREDLRLLPYLIRLARKTLRCIRFGIALSIGLNIIAALLSLAGYLGPMSGALLHNLASLLVILNAGMLYNRQEEGMPCRQSDAK